MVLRDAEVISSVGDLAVEAVTINVACRTVELPLPSYPTKIKGTNN